MTKDDCYQLGYVVKVHGTKGAVVIFLDVDTPLEYYEMESVFIERDNQLVPFFIEKFEQTNQPDKLITHFEEINTIENANSLKGSKLFLPLSQLPVLNEDQFYYHEVINFDIIDRKLGKIGIIDKIVEMPSNDMILFFINDREIMIPLQEPLYEKIDKKNGNVYVNLPEGYLDIFVEDNNDHEV